MLLLPILRDPIYPIKLIYREKSAILIPMRLNRQQIERVAFKLVKELLSEDMILTDDKEKMLTEIEMVITKELEKEDLLDEKVKDILKDKLNEIRNTNIDYYEMFKMVKSKLAEQEEIIL